MYLFSLDSVDLGLCICGETCTSAIRFRTILPSRPVSLATDLGVSRQLTPIVTLQLSWKLKSLHGTVPSAI
jgi:hypothetical protein